MKIESYRWSQITDDAHFKSSKTMALMDHSIAILLTLWKRNQKMVHVCAETDQLQLPIHSKSALPSEWDGGIGEAHGGRGTR
jgi:hypothetical protein